MNVRERVKVSCFPQEKSGFPLSSLLSCRSLVSVKENNDRKRKKEEKKRENKYG